MSSVVPNPTAQRLSHMAACQTMFGLRETFHLVPAQASC